MPTDKSQGNLLTVKGSSNNDSLIDVRRLRIELLSNNMGVDLETFLRKGNRFIKLKGKVIAI